MRGQVKGNCCLGCHHGNGKDSFPWISIFSPKHPYWQSIGSELHNNVVNLMQVSPDIMDLTVEPTEI